MSLYCMARIRRLDHSQLQLAEVHARRLDPRSKRRQIRAEPPVTWLPDGVEAEPLAIQDRYRNHVDGAFIPKGDGKALHMLVKFPSSVPVTTREDAAAALALAVDFACSIFGNEAVFAARMDRDEKSLTNADLFIAPRYVKKTKHSEKIAISLSRDLKRMAQKRGGLPTDHTILAAQGTALQDEFSAFLRSRSYQALRGRPKELKGDDWFSPEAYGVAKDREIVEAGQEANRIEWEELAQEQAALEHSAREREERLKAKTKAADKQVADAAQIAADAKRALTEGHRLCEQGRAERAKAAEQLRVAAVAVDEQARRGQRLRGQEEQIRADEHRIAADRQQLVEDRSAADERSRVLDERGSAVLARESAVEDREVAIAQRTTELADRAKQIAKAQADALDVSAQAERDADGIRRAAIADRDKARQSVLATLVADQQLALIARAADDEGLELHLTNDERGVSMNEAAMSTTELDSYRKPWSKMVREIARAVAIMLAQLRDRVADTLTAKRRVEGEAAKLVKDRNDAAALRRSLLVEVTMARGALTVAKSDRLAAAKILDLTKAAAQAWDHIPEDQRSPRVAEAVRLTGIARQAAALPAAEPVAAKKPTSPSAAPSGTDRLNER